MNCYRNAGLFFLLLLSSVLFFGCSNKQKNISYDAWSQFYTIEARTPLYDLKQKRIRYLPFGTTIFIAPNATVKTNNTLIKVYANSKLLEEWYSSERVATPGVAFKQYKGLIAKKSMVGPRNFFRMRGSHIGYYIGYATLDSHFRLGAVYMAVNLISNKRYNYLRSVINKNGIINGKVLDKFSGTYIRTNNMILLLKPDRITKIKETRFPRKLEFELLRTDKFEISLKDLDYDGHGFQRQ